MPPLTLLSVQGALARRVRDAEGKIRIKVVANLGRLDRLSPEKLDPLINGLKRIRPLTLL